MNLHFQPPSADSWKSHGASYYSLSRYLHQKFGGKVWKVSVDGGFSCPNIDGTIGRGGCVFCNTQAFSPSRRLGIPSIAAQIAEGGQRLRARYGADRFIAYFQPSTNTFAPPDRLRTLYEEALACPDVVGLAVGTRPDCVPDDVLDLLAELSQKTWLIVEYGLQSIHAQSLAWMNRGHDFSAFLDAVQRSRARGLAVGAHVILGLPGETRDDMLASATAVAPLGLHAIKLHNLYAVKGTRFGDDVLRSAVRLPSQEEYVGWVCDFLERMPPDCVVDRISGDAPKDFLIGPEWSLDKHGVRRAVEAEFQRRGTCQGSRYPGGQPTTPA